VEVRLDRVESRLGVVEVRLDEVQSELRDVKVSIARGNA